MQKKLNAFIFKFAFYVYGCFGNMYVYSYLVPVKARRKLDLQGLELKSIVSCHTGTGIKLQSSESS